MAENKSFDKQQGQSGPGQQGQKEKDKDKVGQGMTEERTDREAGRPVQLDKEQPEQHGGMKK